MFADLRGPDPGAPDGIKVDTAGNVYSGGSGGIYILDPKGKKLGRIVHGEAATTNIGFGGDDWKTLFFTTPQHRGLGEPEGSRHPGAGAEEGSSQSTAHPRGSALILILREVLRHEDFVVVATALLERLLLESVLHEPETGIEPQRGFIAGDHGQLDELDVPARGIDDRFDQPASDAGPPRFAAGRTCRRALPCGPSWRSVG